MKERWEALPSPPGAIATTVEVWQYRRLLSFIGDRALRKTYRRTILGWLWLFINPLLPIALRALIFGGLLGLGSNGLPYFLFLLAGTVAWDVFAASLMWGTRALEMHSDLTTQIYHPRAILPLGNMAPAMLNLGLKVGVFVLALLFYAVKDGQWYLRADLSILWAFAALGLAFLFALAISFFTSIWGESARDIRFGLGQLLSIWYLLTPVLVSDVASSSGVSSVDAPEPACHHCRDVQVGVVRGRGVLRRGVRSHRHGCHAPVGGRFDVFHPQRGSHRCGTMSAGRRVNDGLPGGGFDSPMR